MEINKLDKMFKGWFVGDFEPVVCSSKEVEVGVKEYTKGEYEPVHYHKVATEITTIVIGRVRMDGKEYIKGDIITILPNQATDFKALEDTIICVVKLPSTNNDKFLGRPND